MLKNILILPDGTELTSGVGQANNIRGTSLTECVNSGEELILGSVCANMMEATVQTPHGGLSLTAGDEVTLYKVDEAGQRHKVGLFSLEKPTRPSANLMKLTGYDRVTRLDRDLTQWLRDLTGWPYTLKVFAGMVCQACGLTLAEGEIPNGDYPVPKFAAEATGRQLMQWIGEICCRFCRANGDGEMEWGWYEDSGITIGPSGDRYFYQGTLTFEDYRVAPIEAVQMKLTDHEDGALWPAAEAGANTYIISGNPILMAAVTAKTEAALRTIRAELAGVSYTPCKVSLPASMDIRAGQTVTIRDRNGKELTACVMTRTQKGQRDTLECTGSPRRDSSTAQHNKPVSQVARETAARETGKLTQEELLRRLTQNWTDDGLYLTEDGRLAINASALMTGVIVSKDGTVEIDLLNNCVIIHTDDGTSKGRLILNSSGIQGWGWDYEANKYVRTLILNVGSNGAEIDGVLYPDVSTSITTWESKAGLLISSGKAGSRLTLGVSQNETRINGSTVYIKSKAISWKDNGDGTSTLIGT